MTSKSKRSRVLVVDDNTQMAKCLSEMLDVFEIDSEIASNGEEAIEKLEVYNYALVIADSQMPKVSGISLLKYLKRHFSDIPVAIISTRNSAQTGRLAAKYKADYYLSKPIRMSELEDLVENALLKHAG